jgi:ATP-dependent DNA ligase
VGNVDALVFFLFDLLYLDCEVISAAPLHERKEHLRHLLSNVGTPLQYCDHQIGRARSSMPRPANCRLRASSPDPNLGKGRRKG